MAAIGRGSFFRFFLLLFLIFANCHAAAAIHANDPQVDLPAPSYVPLPLPDWFVNLERPINSQDHMQSLSYNDAHMQLNLEYSDLLGYVINSKFIGKLFPNNALALELDYGNEERRINTTWGSLLTAQQLFKLTGEYLEQKLPFAFDSGTVEKRVAQYAFGTEYKYLFPSSSKIDAVDLNAYYAKAQSQSLSPVFFINQGAEYINYRHIAGATSAGGSLGFDVQPWRTSLLGMTLNYDQVNYNQVYLLKNTSCNNHRIGATVDFTQLLFSNVKLDLSGSKREIYDDYSASVSWLLPMPRSNRFEVGIAAEHITSHNSMPNENSYFLKLNYAWDNSDQKLSQYALPRAAVSNDVAAWTAVPAVHMERVLATVDQLTKKIALAITGISPNSGSGLGGTLVTISGTGFVPGAAVFFGGAPATNVAIVNDHTITAYTPPESSAARAATMSVNVTVRNPDNSTVTFPNGFRYTDTPLPTSVNPNVGSVNGGTAVTISGTGFLDSTAVSFGGVTATNIVIVSDTQITCDTPAHAAGTVDIVVTNPQGSGTIANGFTYLATPNPTSASPNFGTTSGATSVIITGSGFTGATSVTFADHAASFTVNSDTQITAITPAHAVGTVNIVVTNPLSSGTLTNGYIYEAIPAPTSINPTAGPIAGGTQVTISGSGFTGTTSVTFGGTPAASFSVISDTEVSAKTPVHFVGAVDVVVANHAGSGTLTNGYTYEKVPAPISNSPTLGKALGGTIVTINGRGFIGTTSVTFGGTSASFTVDNNIQITATTPAHAVGKVDIVVTNHMGSGTLPNAYTYETLPAPASITPGSGKTSGGTAVTISGSGFTGTTSVTFGGIPASSFLVISDTEISAKTPAHAAGTVDVDVKNSIGMGTLKNGYQYL